MLRLEIEFLSGVCYAASERDSSVPEYPPQADRIFSALVSAWAARGENSAERGALEWLEKQPPPTIVASNFAERSSVAVFVPPNDGQTGRAGNIQVMPTGRRRQPRRFPAAIPFDSNMYVDWKAEPDSLTFECLSSLAADVAYVGHSASFVRACFSRSSSVKADGTMTRRAPYAGRLAELERAFHRGDRPSRGQVVLPIRESMTTPSVESMFATAWIVLPGNANESDFVPDVRATAIVAKRLRDALMSSFGKAGEPIPTWISGHDADGRPTRDPHLAIVPMLDVAHTYASGALLGVSLVPPTAITNADELLINALLRLRIDDAESPQMRLTFQPDGTLSDWRLNFADNDARAALRSERYICEEGAYQWASVTPIVLDRHPHAVGASRQTEMESFVVTAVERLGLPTPARVVVSKHGAHNGVVSAYPSGNAPAWTRWTTPSSIASRPLTHAIVEFATPVRGPIIIGAGRFMGLGLLRPLESSASK